MKILAICGVFAKENEAEVREYSKRLVDYAANVFQLRLISGLKGLAENIQVLSAPFIGSYPNGSKLRKFTGFQKEQPLCTYVSFNNIWGIRNISRAKSLKRATDAFAEAPGPDKMIVVYSPHTPFLEAAVYAKKKDPSIKICLLVPDLPQYMNVNARISLGYKLAKKVDIWRFNQLNHHVDSYVFLTEAMAEILNAGKKPYCVVEGIVPGVQLEARGEKGQCSQPDINPLKYIVYTGKMNERFGVKQLVDAFDEIADPSYRLILCGSGDADSYIAQKSRRDSRIFATGQVPYEEAKAWMQKADVLVNPRQNNESYTKYSFPSKILEYLASGKPTVGFLLDGMPRIYQEFIFCADEKGLAETIMHAVNAAPEEKEKRAAAAGTYLQTLSETMVAEKIINLLNSMECV